MSRKTVRNSIAAFLTPATITGLATVHAYPQAVTNEGDFAIATGTMGGIIFVHLVAQKEKRIALGGPTSGVKWRQYQAVLICLYRSDDPKAEVAGQNADDFLEAIVNRLHSDRQLGTAGSQNPIFQGGEGSDTGGDDIEVEATLPRILKGTGGGGGLKQVFATVKFTVAEMMYA